MTNSMQGPDQSVRLTYTIPEGATRLGVSERLLWKLIAQRRVPVLRLGRRTLVTRTAIEDLVAEGGVRTQPGAQITPADVQGAGPRLLRESGS